MNRIQSYEFRARAMAMIKPVMQVLIVAALLAVLPGLISSVVTLRTGANPMDYIEPVTDKMNAFLRSVTPEMTEAAIKAESNALTAELNTAYQTFLSKKGGIYFGMLSLELLLTPMLTVALHGGLLDAARRREVTLAGSMSRLRLAFRALLLFLWMMLRVYAWMLPGLAAMLIGLFVPGMTGLLLMLAGMLASIVMSVRAALHYILAPVALVDDPALTLNGCIAASFRVMRRRKMELFCLEISFVGWMLLLRLVTLMCVSMFGGVLGMALSMMAELLLNVYMSGAQICFYTAYSAKPGDEQAAAPAPEQEDLTLN